MYEIITFEEDLKTKTARDSTKSREGRDMALLRKKLHPSCGVLWTDLKGTKLFLEKQRIQAPPQATQLLGSAQEKQAFKHMNLKINEGYVQKTKEKPTLKGIMHILTQYEKQLKNTRYESA